MADITEEIRQISKRLEQLRQQSKMSIEEFAVVLDKAANTTRSYEQDNTSLISTDALLQLMLHPDFGKDKVKTLLGLDESSRQNGFIYRKHMPSQLVDLGHNLNQADSGYAQKLRTQLNQWQEFQSGLDIFCQLFEEGKSLQTLIASPEYNFEDIYLRLRAVFVNRVVQFNTIKRDEALEKLLKEKYNLKKVYVADVRAPAGSQVRFYDCTPLRVELVSALAAQEVFSYLRSPKYVLLGSGYTVMRMLGNSLASTTQFANTTWIPAVSYPREPGDDHAFSVMPHYSANYLATYLASRFNLSEAIWLPYMETPDAKRKWDLGAQEEVMRLARQTSHAFISVMGVGRKDALGNSYPEHDGYAVDVRKYGQLHTLFEKMEQNGMMQDFAGEIIGHYLDDRRNPMPFDAELRQEAEDLSTEIPLKSLRTIAQRGESWIIGARLYKARAIKMAITTFPDEGENTRLANCLVIDSEIADYLLSD